MWSRWRRPRRGRRIPGAARELSPSRPQGALQRAMPRVILAPMMRIPRMTLGLAAGLLVVGAACSGAVRRGDQAYQAGRYEEALSEYQARAKEDPGDAEAHLKAGRALRALGRVDEARSELGTASRLGLWDADVEIGRLAMDVADYPAAVEALGRAATRDLMDPVAWNALGVAYERVGRAADAETALLSAKRLAPGAPEVYLNLAIVYDRGLGRPGPAYAHYACYAALAPEDAEARMVLWRMAAMREGSAIGSGTPEKDAVCPERANSVGGLALLEVVPVTRLRPTGDPRLAEAERLFRAARYEEAARAAVAAEAGGPLGAGGNLLLGLALLRTRDPFHAVPRLTEAARLDPTLADAWYELGWAYEMAGDKDLATATWQMARDRFPGDSRFTLVLRER